MIYEYTFNMGKIVYLTLNILIVYYKLYTLKEIK